MECGGAMMAGMFALWALVLVALVVGAVFLVRALSDRRGSDSSALGILEERYARGDIDEEEFQQRRRALLTR